MMLLPCNTHGIVEEKLPQQIYNVLKRPYETIFTMLGPIFTMLSFLMYVSLMELLQLALILKRRHVLVNQVRIFCCCGGRN